MTNENQTHKIIIYSTEWCVYCRHVKDYLKDKGISFEEVDVGKDPEQAKMIIEKTGQRGVPVVDIDGQIILGFDQEKIDEILNIK